MKSPIVSIDVSNGNSHYMCFIKNNKRFGKVKKIDHDIEGFKRLLEDIQKLEAETNEKVCAVFEATGVYTKPLERFLRIRDLIFLTEALILILNVVLYVLK